MTKKIVARWNDWQSESIEHLVLREGPEEMIAEAAIIGITDGEAFAVRYRIVCDRLWRFRQAEIELIGVQNIELVSDGLGNWLDGSSVALPELHGAIDIDISITPFTNTLPIRRMGLQAGQTAEILAVYIQVPSLNITTDRQRYTCLDAGERYRYESVDSDFTRDIELDGDGLVVSYPGLFRRVL